MGRDPAHVDCQCDEQDQRDRQCDAPGQRIHGALGRTLVDQHVIQTGTEVPQDEDQEGDDQQRLERLVHGGVRNAPAWRPAGIIAAQATYGVSRRGTLLFGWTLALLGIALFTRLGVWQLARMHEKQAMLDDVHATLLHRSPQPLAGAADAHRLHAYDWTSADGHFVAAPALLLDNQQHDGRSGVRAYRVFQSADATVSPVLAELGWLPVPGNRQMPVVAPITGAQHVAGLLSPPPSAGFVRAVVVPQANGTLLTTSVDIALLRRTLHLPTLALRVLKLDPALPIGYPRDLDILPNTLPPERHLGYAVQWFGLALTVLATALVLTFRKPRASRTR